MPYFLPQPFQELLFSKLYLVHGEKNNPKQGATQKVSSIRYFIALDRFFQTHQRGPDLKTDEDKAEFVTYVGEVVAMDDNFYSVNFSTVCKNYKDYAVGSNFFSVNTVAFSIKAPRGDFLFPARQQNQELMKATNGVLSFLPDSYEHFQQSIHAPPSLILPCAMAGQKAAAGAKAFYYSK